MYRKFTADYIFTGHELLPKDNVLITTDKGIIVDIVNQKDAGDDIEAFKGILTPGFINAHCHLELSHLKNKIPEKTGLVNFVEQVMSKRIVPAEEKLDTMYRAEEELYNSGTVAVGDICNTTDTISVKQKSKIKWHNFIEVSGFVDVIAHKRLLQAEEILNRFKENNLRATLSPHSSYSVSKTLFGLLNEATAQQLITIHNQESEEENKLYYNKTGDFLNLYKNLGINISDFKSTTKTSLQSWLPLFTKNQSIILVHNTFMKAEDLKWIQYPVSNTQRSIFYCLCPNANRYIESKVPPIDLLRKYNCTIVIGTDSYASNGQLNMLDEMKAIQHETAFSVLLREILQWGTINGAKAFRMQDELGSFEKGKQPGVVLIDKVDNLQLTKQSSAKRIL